jgi:hypothetical protein
MREVVFLHSLCWLVKCFALSRTILLDSVEFGKVKLKRDFKNLHNYLKINILAKKAKNTEGVTTACAVYTVK